MPLGRPGKPDETNQLLVYADDANLLRRNRDFFFLFAPTFGA
jgi:hypothetical protein